MVDIEWVNHASFVLRSGQTSLLSDPWLFGSAFNDGWELLVPSQFTTADMAEVSALWFSHVHPDHFAPQVLKQVPKDVRKRLPVYFQKTSDQQVAKFCRGIGFPVTEVPGGDSVDVADDFRLTIGRVPFYDSWSLVETGGKRILNLNDCLLHRKKDLDRLTEEVGHVDVLLTQFSYAQWIGGPDDVAARKEAATEKLEWMSRQLEAIRPKICIPFASFVRFAHEENAYLNDQRNTVEAAVEVIERAGSRPVVLYPGDNWTVGEPHDSTLAMKRYAAAWDVADQPLLRSRSVDLEQLLFLGQKTHKRMTKRNNRLLLRLASLPPAHFGGPITIHVSDLDRVVEFHWATGLRVVDAPPDQASISMHSHSLAFILRFDYGIDTLSVNGRFSADENGRSRVLRAFGVNQLNNNGRALQLRLLADPWIVHRAFNRFVRKASG